MDDLPNTTTTGSNNGGTNRPRRPSPDTIAYLRSLPMDYETTRIEIQQYQEYLQQQQQQQLNHHSVATVNKTNDIDIDNDTNAIVETMEYPISLSVAIQAIYEIQHELASLAGDEYGSEMIELLCHITIPISKTICRMILQGMNGDPTIIQPPQQPQPQPQQQYAVHLATHRYGSHVLQTILQLSSQHCYHDDNDNNNNNMDLALNTDAPILPNSTSHDENTKSTIMDHIVHIASSLQPVATDLMVHICGSHCLRTILCILGNVTLTSCNTTVAMTNSSTSSNNSMIQPFSQQRRGKIKSSKKKKKKKLDANHSSSDQQHDTGRNNPLNEPRMMYRSSYWSSPTIPMMDLLRKFTTSLTAVVHSDHNDNSITTSSTAMVGPGQLQSWVCHASAGPVITVLVQVWAYYEYANEQNDNNNNNKWDVLRQQQLQWEVQQTTPDRHIGIQRPEPIYQVGSMTDTIVRRILCWRNDIEQQTYGSDVLYGYAGEPRGSHCLETILRISPDPIYEQILTTCNIYDTSTMNEYVNDTVSNFVLQTILQTIRSSNQAHSILQAIVPNMAYILDPINKRRWIVWRMVELGVTYMDCQSMVINMITDGFAILQLTQSNTTIDGTKNASTTTTDKVKMKLNKCISKLLNIIPPKEYGDRVGVDIAGTRIIYHLLQYQTDFCSDTIKGILELSSNEMELLLKDPFVSRCIFDEIILPSNHKHHESGRPPSMYINARKRLVSKLQNRWVNVATDRVGHHMIKQLFLSLDDIDDKKLIVDELIIGKNRMNSNSMGRSVLDALYVRIYEMNGEKEWINTMKRQVSKQEWLNEIIDTKKEKANDHPLTKNITTMDTDDDDNGGSIKKKRELTMNDTESDAVKKKKKQLVSKSVDSIMDALSIPTQQ